MGAEGVLWGQVSSPTLTRYHGDASGNTVYSPTSQAAATSYFSARSPWGSMGRVSMRPDGSVASRCPVNQTSLQVANNWGDNCYSDTNDDANRQQKMVYVHQFCFYIDYVAAHNIVYWVGQIGDTFTLQAADGTFTGATYTFTSSDIHPAFSVDGVAKSGIYIGAYTAYNSSNVLQSVAGVTPTSTNAPLTIANARTYAYALNSVSSIKNWGLTTIQTYLAVAMLCFVEYATFYVRSALGTGVLSGSLANTGGTVSYGNASYGSPTTTVQMTYRGIEDFWGNMGYFIEGMNFKANATPFIAPQSVVNTYACDTFTGVYADTTHTQPATGWVSAVYPDWEFISSSTAGSPSSSLSTYLCSNQQYATVNRVPFLGWSLSGGLSGLFSYVAQYSSVSTANLGYRIQYLPS